MFSTLQILNCFRKDRDEAAEQIPLASANPTAASQGFHPALLKTALYLQFGYNLIDSFGGTAYSNAVLMTDLLEWTPDVIGLSFKSLYISVPLAILFALSEAYSHWAESKVINESEEPEIEPAHPAGPSALNWKQKLFAGMHYLSDTLNGGAMPIVFAKLAGIDNCTKLARALTYAGIFSYSGAGNLMEFLNVITSFRKENVRNEPTAPRRCNWSPC